MYGKVYDNQLRNAVRGGSVPEQFLEYSEIKEKWDAVAAQVANEDAERKAKTQVSQEAEAEEDVMSVQGLRKGPSHFALHSKKYWRAVANQTVRSYVTLIPEPKTTDGVSHAVSQSPLKDVQGNVVTWLDVNLLGESLGPGAAEGLRKKYVPTEDVTRKLVQGSLLGRGSQRLEDGQATKPCEGELVVIHLGDRPRKEARALFKLRTARADAGPDCDERVITLAFQDEAMRARKTKVRGEYSLISALSVYTDAALASRIPDRAYPHHGGSTSADLIALIKVLPSSELWHLARHLAFV